MKTLLSVIFFLFCFGAYSQKYETGKYFINEKKDTIYITPEQMPEFPGGLKNCMRFLSKNTKLNKKQGLFFADPVFYFSKVLDVPAV